MGRLVVALSAVVSGRSAWLLLGFTGMAYSMGLSSLWAVAGYTTVEFFLFLFYAPKLRRFSEKHDCITLPDFFDARFPDSRGTLRILLIFIFLVFMVEISQITPPVGFSIFVIQSISNESVSFILRSTYPFFLIMIFVVILITLFPGIVFYLPGEMIR